jgi:hypothetical protein
MPTFLRADADLTIVIFTDAPEQSSALPTEYAQELRLLTGARNVHTALFLPYGPTFQCATPVSEGAWAHVGSRYEQWSSVVDSTYYQFCAITELVPSMIDVASGVSARARVGTPVNPDPTAPLTDTLQLTETPDPASIVVTYDGQTVAQGFPGSGRWLYNPARNAIWFHDLSFLIPGMDTIQVRYTERAD